MKSRPMFRRARVTSCCRDHRPKIALLGHPPPSPTSRTRTASPSSSTTSSRRFLPHQAVRARRRHRRYPSATKFLGGHGTVDRRRHRRRRNVRVVRRTSTSSRPHRSRPVVPRRAATRPRSATASPTSSRPACSCCATSAPPSRPSAWLLIQGIETLSLRIERHVQNAQEIAEWLENQPRRGRPRSTTPACRPRACYAAREHVRPQGRRRGAVVRAQGRRRGGPRVRQPR